MSEATATDADEALLDELAGLLMSAARMAHARMEAAQDDAAFNAAGQTLHRMARSLRQTLALKGKLARERDEAGRKAEARASDRRQGERIDRRQAVEAAVERILWTEHESWDEDDYADRYIAEIQDRAEAAAADPDFLDLPIAVHVARICGAMNLPVPPSADPEPHPTPPTDPPWRSSG